MFISATALHIVTAGVRVRATNLSSMQNYSCHTMAKLDEQCQVTALLTVLSPTANGLLEGREQSAVGAFVCAATMGATEDSPYAVRVVDNHSSY
jgi:hypothetical protein